MNPQFLPAPLFSSCHSFHVKKKIVVMSSYPPLHCERQKWAMRMTLGSYLKLLIQHAQHDAQCSYSNCFHVCSKEAFHICLAFCTFIWKTKGFPLMKRKICLPSSGKHLWTRLGHHLPHAVHSFTVFQSSAWALKKSLTRPEFFLSFREIRKNRSLAVSQLRASVIAVILALHCCLCQWAPAACLGFLRFPFGPVGA